MARKENASYEKQNQRTTKQQETGITNANDLTPTYTVPNTASELKSGERLTIAMGKIARAVIDLIAHIADKNNPHEVDKSDVGLDKADNTSDADKPISTATQSALDNKVDKVTGKGLSTNDYTTAEKEKLSGIEAGAQVNDVTGVKGDSESSYRTGNVNITKANIGLGNVENKSSETIRGEITKANVTDALGYTPPEQDTVYEHPASGVAAGTYKSVTVDSKGHVTGGSNPTSLAGYGITDAESKGAAASEVSAHDSSDSAHSDIRALISALQSTLNSFLDVDDTTKDQLSEVLKLIEDNKDLIEGITTSKVSVSDIVNDLTTNSSSKVLSAAQGVALKALIDALQAEVNKKALASDLESHTGDTTVHITATERTNWNDANTKKHEHSNKSVLNGITSTLISAWNSAVTHISDAVAHITSTERTNWNDANSKKHEHRNKSVLDGITSTLITAWNAAKTAVDKLGTAAYTDASDYASAEKGIYFILGTGDTAGTWLGSHDDITEYYDGLMIAYKIGIAGVSGGTTLNINDLGAVAVVRNATTVVTTHYPVDSVIFLIYTVDDETAYWKVADYDANTKNSAGSSNKTGTKLYLIGAASQSSSGVTSYSNTNLYIGTDNKLYAVEGFDGDLTGNADTADALNTDAGSATQPVYFEKGIPKACTYTLEKSVPSDAVFTDTTYAEATTSKAGLMSATDKEKLDSISTDGSDKAPVYYATFAADGWSDTSPYEQTVTVDGILAADEPVAVKYKTTDISEDDAKAYEKAFGILSAGAAETLSGQVRWVCFEKPETDITIGLICV